MVVLMLVVVQPGIGCADVRYCIDGEGAPWCCVVDVSDVGYRW